jgi:hypothetical protein
METVVILLMALLVLDAAAWRWGFDSRNTWNSAEWERRRNWPAFHEIRTRLFQTITVLICFLT